MTFKVNDVLLLAEKTKCVETKWYASVWLGLGVARMEGYVLCPSDSML